VIKFIRRPVMKLSARNNLKGKIVALKVGMVNVEVDIEIAGGAVITSIITKESCENLGLEVGKTAYAVMKASSIMVAVD
jgi:molybdate transport system regulatory protein